MRFYGTSESLNSWKSIIETNLNKQCNEIVEVDNRKNFSVDLTAEDREYLYDNHWYVVEEEYDMPWNHRIAFGE